MDVTAVYELPVPIWVTHTAMGQAYQAGHGRLRFNIVMPSDDSPTGGPPAMPGTGHPLVPSEEKLVWAQEYGATIPESLKPATAVHRVAVTSVEGPTYADRSWFTPDHQLAGAIDGWFDEVRTWVEIFTGQDLDPRHRVYDAEAVGAGLTFIEPPHQEALGVIITTPHIRPLRGSEWASILNLVSNGTEPPLEEILSRDARAAQKRNANRRAVLDAATALEIALGRHIRSHADSLPPSQKKRINNRTALGDYISIAETSRLQLAVTAEQLHRVNKLRNDAAHRGGAPDNWAAGTAVQVMIDFLGVHGRYRRTSSTESTGENIPEETSRREYTGHGGRRSEADGSPSE